MTDYGYLNHSSIDKRDDLAIDAIFGSVACEHIVIEQEWMQGETSRPAFEQILAVLSAGDTLYISSIDRLGLNVEDTVRLWHVITKEKGANIVVLNDPILNSRKNRQLTTKRLTASARAAFIDLAAEFPPIE